MLHGGHQCTKAHWRFRRNCLPWVFPPFTQRHSLASKRPTRLLKSLSFCFVHLFFEVTCPALTAGLAVCSIHRLLQYSFSYQPNWVHTSSTGRAFSTILNKCSFLCFWNATSCQFTVLPTQTWTHIRIMVLAAKALMQEIDKWQYGNWLICMCLGEGHARGLIASDFGRWRKTIYVVCMA